MPAARAARPIRLATKSVRCVDILRRALAHPAFDGLMAFTPAEAAFLAEQGFDDILVAYPNVDETELDRALDAVRAGATIVFMVDAPEQVLALSERALHRDTYAEVCLEVDLSLSLPGLHFGVRRSPIQSAEGWGPRLLPARQSWRTLRTL